MASVSDIAKLRKNTDEPDETTFSDAYVGELIDALGVAGASAEVWREKAASYAKLVNTQEAGASRSLSDLMKNALAMAKSFDTEEAAVEVAAADHPVSRRIVRT
jgi:phage-related minor tail protein